MAQTESADSLYIWTWRATGKRVISVIEAVCPHPVIERRQADVCLEMAKRITTRSDRCTEDFRLAERQSRHVLCLRAKSLNLPCHLREEAAVHAEKGDYTKLDHGCKS